MIELMLASIVSSSTVSQTEAELFRAGIYLEGRLRECEVREDALRQKLRIRTPTVAASLVELERDDTALIMISSGAIGAAIGVILALVVGAR